MLPLHAIWWNEREQVPQKCTLCAHLLDEGWKQPRCVQACPTGALQLVPLDEAEIQLRSQSEKLEFLHPEYKTKPRVYYRNMHRYASCFIAGSVALAKNGAQECLSGASVSLFRNGHVEVEAVTDAFGDFKFDQLASSEEYEVVIAVEGMGKKTISIRRLEKSASLKTIVFE